MNDDRLEWSFTFAPESTPADTLRNETTNAIIGRWLVAKMRRLIRETPEGDGPHRGAWEFGPYGRAALNLKKQGAGLGIARLTLFGRV